MNIEMIEKLGGFVTDDRKKVYFRFAKKVSISDGQTITLSEALKIEKQLIGAGYDGALIGHPLDESDEYCIYFENLK